VATEWMEGERAGGRKEEGWMERREKGREIRASERESRTAHVICVEACDLLELRKDAVLAVLGKSPALYRALRKTVRSYPPHPPSSFSLSLSLYLSLSLSHFLFISLSLFLFASLPSSLPSFLPPSALQFFLSLCSLPTFPPFCFIIIHPPSSVVLYTQGRESGGSGFETRSGVISQASLL
jgi:hypothetical protein